ncbi:hypothetical protein C8N42_103217 [Celeribacter persicus]|jgi:hypothetical protein|uniref:Uncharacterized protein n=1 Tax=Celeribacter persicus TaxID=1651082 RepID=A0A2T5HTS0_9RHOB|nr:hypothetical protein C8N42_103217 [Celeribacter persicus]
MVMPKAASVMLSKPRSTSVTDADFEMTDNGFFPGFGILK